MTRGWGPPLLAACLLSVACGRAPAPPERLVLALPAIPQTGLVAIAAARGDFAAEGLAVTLQRRAFGRLALDAVLAGEADVAAVAETPLVMAALRGARPAALATICRATGSNAILARRAAGVASPRDLVGRRVGLPRGTTAEFLLEQVRIGAGLRRDAVQVVDLQPDQLEGALRRAEVDAVVIWDPFVGQLLDRLGPALVQVPDPTEYSETFGLVARPGLVRERPAAAARLLRALLRAEAFARERPEEARALVAAAAGMPPEQLRGRWASYELRVRLDQGLLALLEQEARWAIRAGLVPPQPTPDLREILAPDPLQAVRPEAVHLIR